MLKAIIQRATINQTTSSVFNISSSQPGGVSYSINSTVTESSLLYTVPSGKIARIQIDQWVAGGSMIARAVNNTIPSSYLYMSVGCERVINITGYPNSNQFSVPLLFQPLTSSTGNLSYLSFDFGSSSLIYFQTVTIGSVLGSLSSRFDSFASYLNLGSTTPIKAFYFLKAGETFGVEHRIKYGFTGNSDSIASNLYSISTNAAFTISFRIFEEDGE